VRSSNLKDTLEMKNQTGILSEAYQKRSNQAPKACFVPYAV